VIWNIKYLSAGAKSLEDTLRRSVVGITEAHRQLNMGLEKFKASLLESTGGGGEGLSFSHRGIWVNKAEHICQDILDEVEQFMEESGASQREGQLGPLKEAMSRTM
jgi:hypothetical protein